jgi:hypothetical protein
MADRQWEFAGLQQESGGKAKARDERAYLRFTPHCSFLSPCPLPHLARYNQEVELWHELP